MRSVHLLPLLLVACATSVPDHGLLTRLDRPALSEFQLRERVNDVVRTFSSVVEEAADEIVARSKDPAVRRAAVRWKTNATQACALAGFRLDPAAALVDIRALSVQQADFFDHGAGAGLLGEEQATALAACRRLVEITRAAGLETVGGDEANPEFQAFEKTWADKYPVESLEFARPWPPEFMEYLRGRVESGALGAVQSLDAQVLALMQLLPTQIAGAVKQAVWQAELLLGRNLPRADVEAIRSDLHALALDVDAASKEVRSLSSSMVEIRKVVVDVPELVGSEHRAVVDLANAQRAALAADVDRQTDKLLVAADEQRQRLTAALQAQVGDLTKEVERQRFDTLATLKSERAALVHDVDGLRARTLEDLRAEAPALAAGAGEEVRAWIRYLVTMSAAMLAGAIVLGALVFGLVARRRTQSGPVR